MALVTLNSVKARLGIGLGNPTYDARLTEMIDEATSFIEGVCNTYIEQRTLTAEPFDGNGRAAWTPSYIGVSAASALQVRIGVGSDATWEAIATTEWEFQKSPRGAASIYYPPCFVRGHKNYRITLAVGYASVPEVMYGIAREYAMKKWMDMPSSDGEGRFGKKSESESKDGATFTTSFEDLEKKWKADLAKYRVRNV
jgi:hypothetical protein